MLIPHEGPEVRSHFLRRSNLALVVYHLRKTINCLLNARPFAAASFAWLMSTQLHGPHHGIAEHRREACAPIPRDRWERRRQFVCPMSATGHFGDMPAHGNDVCFYRGRAEVVGTRPNRRE